MKKATLDIWCVHTSKPKVMHQMFNVQTIDFFHATIKIFPLLEGFFLLLLQ